MEASYISTFVLTILLAIGLGFFLRAASKDRTTVVDIVSSLPPVEVLAGISTWLEERGWKSSGGDPDERILRFNGEVSYSRLLAIFLSVLCGLGGACLGLVLSLVFPGLGWWPLCFALIAPFAGVFYRQRAFREECVELKLLKVSDGSYSTYRIRAHRDELIAMELELSKKLGLKSDGALLSSPI